MEIQTQVKSTISKYKLCNKNEKILVALSGGKDSATCCYLLHNLGYKIEGFHINLGLGGYSEKCEKAVRELCRQLDIKLHIYDFKKKHGSSMCFLRTSIQSKKALKNCAICGVIKKWIINKECRKLGAKKIATGHHLDDEAQTFFLNILKGAPELNANTGPITRNVKDKKFIPRIKPLFYVLEKDIKAFAKRKKLPVVYDKCPCALDSYRLQVRKFFKTLSDQEKKNIIKNFDKLKDKLKIDEEIIYCKFCNEPSRNKICKRCELLRV
jgi:uncharacterized protein (TIGR00269 family)